MLEGFSSSPNETQVEDCQDKRDWQKKNSLTMDEAKAKTKTPIF